MNIIEQGKRALKRYSQRVTKLHALELKPEVKEYLQLQDKIKDDQRIISQAARENLEDMKNGNVEAKVSRAWKKWYDPKVLQKKATPQEWKHIEKCLDMKVNKTKFEDLIKEDKVDKKLKQLAFREQEMTPRVSIKEVL